MTPSLTTSSDALSQQAVRDVLGALQKVSYNRQFGTMTPALKTSGSALVKYTSAFTGIVGGLPVQSGASGDFPALSGTISDGYYNVYCFYINQSGTLSSTMGTQATTLDGVVFPATPSGKCMVAFITVYTTGASFIGGTTALDAGTATVKYYDGWEPAATQL